MKWILIYWFVSGYATGSGVAATGEVYFYSEKACRKALEEFKSAEAGYNKSYKAICVFSG